MLGFASLSEVPISAVRTVEGLPFGAFASIGISASGTPSLLRVSSAAAVVSFAAFGSMRVIVLASAAAVIDISASGTPNYTLYAATREFISRANDQVPNQPFYGTLVQNIQFDQSIISNAGFGDVTLAWGELELINADGYYDNVIGQYAADGRRVLLKVGDERKILTDGYDSFFSVFDGIATGIHVEEGVMRVYLRDRMYQLEVPVLPSIYGGTGGIDGSEDNKGKRKPKCWGYCSNVPALLIVPYLKLFQVHDGPIQAITGVYSRGAAVTFDQDYASAAALIAATIPAGRYATCLAAGLFRVNFVLEGDITADVQGDKTGGTFVSTTADIIQRMITTTTGFSASDLDAPSFARVNATQPAPVGYYLDTSSDASVADAIADLLRPIGGYGGFQGKGRVFEIGLFRAPAGVPNASYDRIDVIEIKREQLPSGISPPPYRYRVGWGRNFLVQTDVASGITAERKAYLSEQYRLSEAADGYIRTDHPLAQDPAIVEGWFRDEADAETEADRLLDLYGSSSYSLYRMVLKQKPFVHRVGDLVWLAYPRWDLVDGRLLRVVSVSEKIASSEVEIVGFG